MIGLAVVLALCGTFAVYAYANHADQRAQAEVRGVEVLIVQNGIPAGTTWHDVRQGSYVKQEKVPANAAPADALAASSDEVPDAQVATTAIASGQVLVRSMFAEEQSAVTGPVAIPSGKIAVSVSLSSDADVAGYVQKGSQVAVFATYKLKTPNTEPTSVGDNMYTTKLLLPKITVLATSQAAPSSVDGAKSTSSSQSDVIVTLAVSQTDAERLILSQQTGELYLGLLTTDSKTAPDGGVHNAGVFKPAPIFLNN
jgi:pilus assembly protein CpaB